MVAIATNVFSSLDFHEKFMLSVLNQGHAIDEN